MKNQTLSNLGRNVLFSSLFGGLIAILFIYGAGGVAYSERLADPEEPVLVFSSYYGGSTHECQFEICVLTTDPAGNIYIAGSTTSDDFPLVDSYSAVFSPGSGTDIVVVKLEAGTKRVLYSSYIGKGMAQGIAVDAAGNVTVAGFTGDSTFPTTTNGAQQTFAGGAFDGVLFTLSSDGSELLYSTFLGGTDRELLFDVEVDGAGSLYVTGWTASADYPTLNAAQATFGGNTDTVVTKIAPDGSLAYSTFMGGVNREDGIGLEVDGSGNVVVAGRSASDNFPTTAGAFQTVRDSGAGNDATIFKLNPAGGLVASTFYGTVRNTAGVDVGLDSNGNIYVLTITEGVIKLNGALSQLLFQTDLEMTSSIDGEGGLVVDSEGIAFVTGWNGSGIDRDVVLAAVGSGGQLLHYQTVGGSNQDFGYSLSLVEDSNGKKTAFIAGRTQSADFPVLNPIQDTLNGTEDILLIEITNLENIGPKLLYLPMIGR
ncbi:MAG: SBBP repeat-containing protein [Anaerolineae bacterium]